MLRRIWRVHAFLYPDKTPFFKRGFVSSASDVIGEGVPARPKVATKELKGALFLVESWRLTTSRYLNQRIAPMVTCFSHNALGSQALLFAGANRRACGRPWL